MMTSDEIRGFGMGDEFHSTLKMVESVFLVYRNCPVLPSGYVKIAIENDHL